MRMIRAHISSLSSLSGSAPVPYVYAEGIQNENLKSRKTDVCTEHMRKEIDVYAERAHQLLMFKLSACIRSCCVSLAYT